MAVKARRTHVGLLGEILYTQLFGKIFFQTVNCAGNLVATAPCRCDVAQSCSLRSGKEAKNNFTVEHWRKDGNALGFVK